MSKNRSRKRQSHQEGLRVEPISRRQAPRYGCEGFQPDPSVDGQRLRRRDRRRKRDGSQRRGRQEVGWVPSKETQAGVLQEQEIEAEGKEMTGKIPTPPNATWGPHKRSLGIRYVHRRRTAQPQDLPFEVYDLQGYKPNTQREDGWRAGKIPTPLKAAWGPHKRSLGFHRVYRHAALPRGLPHHPSDRIHINPAQGGGCAQ